MGFVPPSKTGILFDVSTSLKSRRLLCCQEKDFVVHFFEVKAESDVELHGKIIPHTYFRGSARDRPDAKLLLWHYRQCAMAHFRGFACRLSIQDALDTVATFNT